MQSEQNLQVIKRKCRLGRPRTKHGGYSLYQADLIKQHPELRHYLEDSRFGLIADISAEGEAGLTAGQLILIDRVTQKLGLTRLIELYISKTGILRRDKLDNKTLEIEPILIYWQSLNNAIRADLQLLGIERRVQDDSEPDLQRYLKAKADKGSQERAGHEGKKKTP